MASSSNAASNTNGSTPPPGAEYRKVYTEQEKHELLEQFLLARAAKEGSDAQICERLGVGTTAIYKWRAILERGGSLAPMSPEEIRKNRSKAQKKAAKRKKANAGNRQGTGGYPIAFRLKVLAEWNTAKESGNETGQDVAKRHGISVGSMQNWEKDLKLGKYTSQGRPVNQHGTPHQIVMFEEAPPPAQKPPRIEVGHAIEVRSARAESPDLLTELALLKAENARLKARVKKLIVMVGDDG